MIRRLGVLLLAVSAVTSSACTYHRAYFDHAEVEEKMPIRNAAWDGELIGPLRAGEGGAIWEKCTNIARGSIWLLMDDARKMGGNAIGDVRWMPQNPKHTADDPSCKKKWGWFLIWPVLLTPGFQSARVDANAYLVPEDSQHTGIYLIPDSDEDRMLVVERLLAETFLQTGERVQMPDFDACSNTGG